MRNPIQHHIYINKKIKENIKYWGNINWSNDIISPNKYTYNQNTTKWYKRKWSKHTCTTYTIHQICVRVRNHIEKSVMWAFTSQDIEWGVCHHKLVYIPTTIYDKSQQVVKDENANHTPTTIWNGGSGVAPTTTGKEQTDDGGLINHHWETIYNQQQIRFKPTHCKDNGTIHRHHLQFWTKTWSWSNQKKPNEGGCQRLRLKGLVESKVLVTPLGW